MKPKWAIYIRVSTRHQAEEGFSLQDQRERLIAYAAERGWSYQVFEDAGESGENLEERPGLVHLLKLADAGEITGVLVTDESRLARDELVGAVIRDRLKRTGTKLATLRGEHDLTDPSKNFIANMLAAAHAFDQDLRTEKMKAGLRNAALKGFWPGGPPPYGYQLIEAPEDRAHKQLVICDEEACLIRLAADLIVNQGFTTYSAARYLNDQGFKTRGVKHKDPNKSGPRQWRHQNLRHQLHKRHLTGTWVYKQGDERIEVSIPAIFTQEEWDQIQASIKGKPRPQRKNRLYPLTGRGRNHLQCQCGANFFGVVRKEKKGRAYYTCSNSYQGFSDDRCLHRPRTIHAVPLEEAVWAEVYEVLTNPAYLIELAQTFISDSDKQQKQKAGELHQLQVKFERLDKQETRIVRDLADQDLLHLAEGALAEIARDKKLVQTRLDEIDAQPSPTNISEEQIRNLTEQARSRLDSPTPELMAEVFDLLDIRLHRAADNRFEGTGTIPIPEDGDIEELLPVGLTGEVSAKGPQRLSPHRPRSERVSQRG